MRRVFGRSRLEIRTLLGFTGLDQQANIACDLHRHRPRGKNTLKRITVVGIVLYTTGKRNTGRV